MIMVQGKNKNGTIFRMYGKKWYQNKLEMVQVKFKNGTKKLNMVLILTFMVHDKKYQKQYFPKMVQGKYNYPIINNKLIYIIFYYFIKILNIIKSIKI